MDDGEPTVELDLAVVKLADWAILVSDGSKMVWLPKSLLRPLNKAIDDYEGRSLVFGKEGEGESVTLTVSEWLAIEEELV